MSSASPSLVPSFDVTVYLVLDDFGRLGRSYLETNEEKASLDSVVRGMIDGDYGNPVRVVAFNTAEGWSSDVSEDVNRADATNTRLPEATHDFVSFYLGEPIALRAAGGLL